MSIAEKGQVLPFSDFLSSVGHLVDGRICVVKEDDEAEKEGFSYQKAEGRGATNWTMVELPKVIMLEK